MKKLNPEKLFVEFRPYVSPVAPICPRVYTLTHSDITAELFLTLGSWIAYDKVTSMRDEVVGSWRVENNRYYFNVYVYVGNFGQKETLLRDAIFRRELPLALEAVFYGDRQFLLAQPLLVQAPIWIHFDSEDPAFNKLEYWGKPLDYI